MFIKNRRDEKLHFIYLTDEIIENLSMPIKEKKITKTSNSLVIHRNISAMKLYT